MLDYLKRIEEFVRDRPELNGLFQLVLLAVGCYLLYRFAMHPRFGRFRRAFPGLDRWYGHREVRALIRSGEHARAGERLLALGQPHQAIEAFQSGNLFARAADVHLKLKQPAKAALMLERAGSYERAASLHIELQDWDRAEKNLERIGKLDELGELFLKRGLSDRAVESFLKVGAHKKAAEVLESQEKFGEAAEILEVAVSRLDPAGPGDSPSPHRKALRHEIARLLEASGRFEDAVAIYVEEQDIPAAVRGLRSAGQDLRAAELLRDNGALQEAAEIFAATGQSEEAARLRGEEAYQDNRLADAVAAFQQAGDFVRAAEIYRDFQENDKAAAMYERAGELTLAASLYRETGATERAATVYERAERWEEAIACYREAGLAEPELALLEKIGDRVGMAENLYRRGLADEAFEALTTLSPKDPRFRSGLSLKGKILLDRGEPMEAMTCFEQAISGAEQLSGEDVDTIYNLAVAADQTQSASNAMEVLERMLAQDLVEDSARDKAQNVRKLLSERAFTHMSGISRSLISGESAFDASENVLRQSGSTAPSRRRYKTVKEIGRGGMGVVYTAKDLTLDRIVALKVLSSTLKQNEQAVQTFLREAKAAAALNHPNIVTVHDAGTQDSEYYIAMEFIEGRTVKEIIRQYQKLDYPSVFEVLRQLLGALNYAHSRNVVHRDLTTSNIMWTKHKSVKIMDFGLAKIVKELQSEQSIVGGTPSFMSPEQTLGSPIDHRTDIYSLGICVFEMALGSLPFAKGDLGFHHLHTPPPIPGDLDANLPPVFNDIVLKCMAKEPGDRFQSADEIRELLDRAE